MLWSESNSPHSRIPMHMKGNKSLAPPPFSAYEPIQSIQLRSVLGQQVKLALFTLCEAKLRR